MWHWIGWLPKRECTTGHCCIPTSFPHSSCSMYQHTLCLRHQENKSLHSLTIKSEASISHLLHEGILAIVSWVFQFIVLLVMFTWEIILISTLIRKCLIVHLCFVINPKSEENSVDRNFFGTRDWVQGFTRFRYENYNCQMISNLYSSSWTDCLFLYNKVR